MKIAFPSQDDNGLESRVHGHFGSAHRFIIFNMGQTCAGHGADAGCVH